MNLTTSTRPDAARAREWTKLLTRHTVAAGASGDH